MARLRTLPRIVIDTREQLPYEFAGYDTVVRKLDAGDYSLEGHEHAVAVERKSKQDAYGCVGSGRDRFVRCLDRLGAMDRTCVVIECSLADFAQPPSHTKITAAQAVGSYVGWSMRYRIPVYWCWDDPVRRITARQFAERVTLRYLASYAKMINE